MFWQGGTTFNDRPFLMVEGIDAENKNSEAAYFALASELFSQAVAQGADVYVLNFNDGGADLRLNADVVESGIIFLNSSRRGSSARFDVAGVSMGGVVVRIALARMEAAGRQHRVDRFLSIDAPQNKAVLQHSLVDFIKSQADAGRIDPPRNLTSPAGRQLLEYNVYASPNESNNFFDEINQINGNGHPHLSRNLGVSFGSYANNSHAGRQRLRYRVKTYLGVVADSRDFHVANDVGVPGSYLPRDVTKVWAYSCLIPGFCGTGELIRYSAHPTFIPTASALHIVSGQSRFTETMTASAPSFHDRMPTDLANRLLVWLGYQPPMLRVSASGATCIREGYYGVYSAAATGGAGPFIYTWEMRPPCFGGSEALADGETTSAAFGDGPPMDEPNGPSCSDWNQVGIGPQIQYSPTSVPYGQLQIRAEVRDSRGVVATSNTISVNYVPDNGPSSCDAGGGFALGASQPDASAQAFARAALPHQIVLRGGSPNPFLSGSEVVYGLPEDAHVRLAVYDILGREVERLVEGTTPAGWHRVRFDGSRLPGGVYVCRMEVGKQVLTAHITRVN